MKDEHKVQIIKILIKKQRDETGGLKKINDFKAKEQILDYFLMME